MTTATMPTPIAETADSVTLPRRVYEQLLEQLEDTRDRAIVDSYDAWATAVGPEEALRLSYTLAETRRVLDGTSRVTIWRERTGMSGRALAIAAEISPSYLAEIEGGKKPGSVDAIRSIARTLRVPMEHLVG